MPKYRFDALERQDAALSLFVSKQLEIIRAQAFEKRYPQLKGRLLVPINNQIHPGAEDYGYDFYDQVGQAKIVRDYAKDFPRVDVHGDRELQKLKSIGDSYAWSIQEARAAQLARANMSGRKANAARFAIEQKIDTILLLGDDDSGLEGLFNLTGTLTYALPHGSTSGTTVWADKTPDEVLTDLHAIPRYMVVETKEIEQPDTLVLPTDQYGYLTTKRIGDGDSRTLLQKFLADDPYITNVQSSTKLAGLGAGGTDRAVAYRRDPDKLEGLIPQEFEQFPPQYDGMQILTFCHARVGGVVAYYPKSVVYADGV